jgi:signal transduction histidine kinase/HAMP domain-containing protein
MNNLDSYSFSASTSILRRLKIIMISISLFIIVSVFALYLSSQGFLTGLQKINRSNYIATLTSQALESVNVSEENIERLNFDVEIKDIKMSFKDTQAMQRRAVSHAIDLADQSEDIQYHLAMAQVSIQHYEESVGILFNKYESMPDRKRLRDKDVIASELLVAQQFALETKENLRKAQISLRESTDSLFISIYEKRMTPLFVTVVLSLLFFIFVATFGFSIARRIGKSVRNLLHATEAVAKGNLNYAAPILEEDEIGHLTFAFNNMVSSLNEGQKELRLTLDRIWRLQTITAAFSEAITVDEVCEVTLKSGFEALSADAGSLGLLTEDKTEIEIKRNKGYSSDATERWRRFPLSLSTPMGTAIESRRALFFESMEEVREKYSVVGQEAQKNSVHAMAIIPINIGRDCLGSLSLTFNKPKKFSQAEKDFIVAVTRQCAQALQRSDLYDEAQKAIAARDEFLSIASHELKTPLTPLKLQLQMLGRQAKKNDLSNLSPDKILKIVDSADKHMERLGKLIEDLLDVSRITSGKLTLNVERVNLGDMIKEVIIQYSHHLKDAVKKIELVSTPDIEALVDKIRIEQVLINLLTNAAKYAPGQPIQVGLENLGDRARIFVTDHGPGISENDQARIFNRFERAKGTESVAGLGLGLYISQQIITAHMGKIWVESEPEKGSTFYLEIPLMQS